MTRRKYRVLDNPKEGKEFIIINIEGCLGEYLEEDVGSVLKKSLASVGYPAGTLAELVEETNVPTPVWRI